MAAEGPCGRAAAAAKENGRLVLFNTARLQAGRPRSRLRPRAALRRHWEIARERAVRGRKTGGK